jgi:hypothetical protein
MTTTTFPASDKQRGFIASLLTERAVDPTFRATTEHALAHDTLTSKDASGVIATLLALPRTAAVKSNALREVLATIPKSRYAIGVTDLIGTSVTTNNDIVFVEVREYRGTLYMRQLHGAPGSFNRSKLTVQQVKDLVSVIATDPYRYARAFGEHYTCCGSCGAELTDERSRELQLGPECRKKFGF